MNLPSTLDQQMIFIQKETPNSLSAYPQYWGRLWSVPQSPASFPFHLACFPVWHVLFGRLFIRTWLYAWYQLWVLKLCGWILMWVSHLSACNHSARISAICSCFSLASLNPVNSSTLLSFCNFCLFWFFGTGSCYVNQAELQLTEIHLPLPPQPTVLGLKAYDTTPSL